MLRQALQERIVFSVKVTPEDHFLFPTNRRDSCSLRVKSG
jgi:hypothetical protein